MRDVILGALFGIDEQLSAYALALSVPDTLFALVSGGAIGAAFIPIFTRLRTTGSEEAAWRMAGGVLAFVAVAMVVLGVVTWVFAPVLVREVLVRGGSAELATTTTVLLRILLVQPFFLALASVVTAILQSHDRFALAAFAPILYNLCIIGGAVLLSPYLGIYAVAVGVVVGSMLFLGVQVPSVLRLGLVPPRVWPFADPNVRSTFKLLGPRIVGQAAVHVNTVVALSLATLVDEDGAAAAYRYAGTLFVLPVALFGTSVATVAFPALSREAGESDMEGFLYLLRRSVRGILFFILPASAGIAMLREPIVTLLFQYGKVTVDDIPLIATPLLFFTFGMWGYALVDILPRAFYALHDTRTPVKIALLIVALDITLSILLVRPFGLAGLAVAFTVANIAQALLLAWALRRKIGTVMDPATMRFVGKALIAAGLMTLSLLAAGPLLKEFGELPVIAQAVRLGLTIAGAAALYMLVSLALRQEEVAAALRIVRR